MVSMILLFINEHYRKTNKGKKETRKQTNKQKRKTKNKKKTGHKISCPRPPSLFTLKEISIFNVINRKPFIRYLYFVGTSQFFF